MVRRLLVRVLAGPYLSYRGRIPSAVLQSRTIALLEKFRNQVEEMTPEQLDFHPLAGKWSTSEIAFHALRTTRWILRTSDEVRNGKPIPVLERSAIGTTKQVTRSELLTLCQSVIQQTGQFDFAKYTPGICVHPLLGPLNFKQWLGLNLVHLERHFQQLQQIRRS